MSVITRFAPSPTGYLHIWSLRTVLYNYLFAKKNNGKFMLRIEDTDRTRYVGGSIDNMLLVLASVWLIPDEWPNNPGNKWPYYQSERLDIYKQHLKTLLDNDSAYYCFCSSERLTQLREKQEKHSLATKYDGKCRYLSEEEIKEKLDAWEKYTIRLKVPENRDVVFHDTIKWKVTVNSKDIDDQVLLKSDGFPTYHLANVIDDHLMWITHVIRWDEWTPSTPKHILLYEAFWWTPPEFSHIPLLLWTDKKKLSKRTGDVAVEQYLEKWYLSESIINYIALLWWNPKTTQEFFSMSELIERFDLKSVHKSWAVFDPVRLDFFNSKYLKEMDISIVYDKLITYLRRYDKDFLDKVLSFPEEYNKKILSELKTRMKKFEDFKDLTLFLYWEARLPEKELFLNEKMKINDLDIVKKWLNISLEIFKDKNSNLDSINSIKEIFIEKIKEAEMKNGQVLWPTRVALSWEQFSPGWLELIYILWREKSSERIEKILKFLK